MEVLGVFEAQDTPERALIQRLCSAKDPNARAYAIGAIARWWNRDEIAVTVIDIEEPIDLEKLASDENPRVRVAAIVAAGNIPWGQSLTAVLSAPNPTGDRFIELAARTAVVTVKSQLIGWDTNHLPNYIPGWRERLAELQRPPGSPKPVAPAASVTISATPAATGKLRATPEFVAELVKEVRASGDARHGAEVFRRAELACTACHSLEDKGGKVGPPLDAIGSGQPLDFIIGAVLEPQREIKESYEAVELSAKDGRKLTGYIVARDATGVTLREPATGAETKLAPADVAGEKQIGSFMPAGLVDALPRADLRDLFRYLSELGKPK